MSLQKRKALQELLDRITGDETFPYWQHWCHIGPNMVTQNGKFSNMESPNGIIPYCVQYGLYIQYGIPIWFTLPIWLFPLLPLFVAPLSPPSIIIAFKCTIFTRGFGYGFAAAPYMRHDAHNLPTMNKTNKATNFHFFISPLSPTEFFQILTLGYI